MAAVVSATSTSFKRPLWFFVSSWVLMIPLLVFASQWGFSFEHGSKNTEMGAHSDDGNESPAIKVQSAIVYLICALFIMRCGRAILAQFYREVYVSSLCALALLSTLWSQFPMTTLTHAMMLAVNTAFAFYLLERFSADDLLKLMLMVGTLAAFGCLIVVLFFPSFGIQERSSITAGAWEGIFAQKNICGLVMTELLLPAFFVRVDSRSARIFRLAYISVVLSIIAMTRSVGAWVVCVACLLFVATMHFFARMAKKDAAALAFSLAGIAAIGAVLLFSNFDALMYALGKDPTLTGRTRIWSTLLISVTNRPCFGYGYTAFWGGLQGESALSTLVEHGPIAYAENGVLELWLELGAAGVALYFLVFSRAIKDAAFCLVRSASPAAMWYASLLFFIAVSNIEAGKLLSTSDLGLVLSLVAFSGLRREAMNLRSQPRSEAEFGYISADPFPQHPPLAR